MFYNGLAMHRKSIAQLLIKQRNYLAFMGYSRCYKTFIMRNNLIEKILRETPLETRIKITIQAYFLMEYGGTMLMPLDENGKDLPEALDANRKCMEKCNPLLKEVLNDIKQWKTDGMP